MPTSIKRKYLRDSYRFPGFYPSVTVSGVFGDHRARVIRLTRRSKKQSVQPVKVFTTAGTTEGFAEFAIFRARARASILRSTFAASAVGTAV